VRIALAPHRWNLRKTVENTSTPWRRCQPRKKKGLEKNIERATPGEERKDSRVSKTSTVQRKEDQKGGGGIGGRGETGTNHARRAVKKRENRTSGIETEKTLREENNKGRRKERRRSRAERDYRFDEGGYGSAAGG